jgi:hypothetical protein
MSRSVRAFDDDVGFEKSRVEIAFADLEPLERESRTLGVELGLQTFVFDLDVRTEQRFAVFVREESTMVKPVVSKSRRMLLMRPRGMVDRMVRP